jgi:small subunit ribosomal protein S17
MKKKTEKKKVEKKMEKQEMNQGECNDRDCPIHGGLKMRGRTFKGVVISKHPKRIAIELERMNYIRKYERYAKSKIKIHARLPRCMDNEINLGDLIKIQECRPLSKIIHFVVKEKIRDAEEDKK